MRWTWRVEPQQMAQQSQWRKMTKRTRHPERRMSWFVFECDRRSHHCRPSPPPLHPSTSSFPPRIVFISLPLIQPSPNEEPCQQRAHRHRRTVQQGVVNPCRPNTISDSVSPLALAHLQISYSNRVPSYSDALHLSPALTETLYDRKIRPVIRGLFFFSHLLP